MSNPVSSMSEKGSWHNLTFHVPIAESMTLGPTPAEQGKFLIKGTAINETTTRNGMKYIARELEPAAPSLRNKPILKDHTNSVDSIVGMTTSNCTYSSMQHCVLFEAEIKNNQMQQMINDKMISAVSVGAYVDHFEEDDDGTPVACGIQFVELSLVAVPADPNAGFQAMTSYDLAIAESYEGFKKEKVREDKNGGSPMSETEEKYTASLKEKDEAIAKAQAALKEKDAQISAFVEAKMAKLREDYATLAKEKNVTARDVSKTSEETLKVLIETLKDIKSPVQAEPGFKGKTATQEDAPSKSALEGYDVFREGTKFGITVKEYPTHLRTLNWTDRQPLAKKE